jgi:hypothetical protein
MTVTLRLGKFICYEVLGRVYLEKIWGYPMKTEADTYRNSIVPNLHASCGMMSTSLGKRINLF